MLADRTRVTEGTALVDADQKAKHQAGDASRRNAPRIASDSSLTVGCASIQRCRLTNYGRQPE